MLRKNMTIEQRIAVVEVITEVTANFILSADESDNEKDLFHSYAKAVESLDTIRDVSGHKTQVYYISATLMLYHLVDRLKELEPSLHDCFEKYFKR